MNIFKNNLNIKLLLDNVLTEESLNDIIKNTEDVNLLSTAIKLKLCLIEDGKHNPISFNTQNLYLQATNDTFETLQTALLIQANNEQYNCLINYINSYFISDFKYESASFYNGLKLIKIAMDVAELKYKNELILDGLNPDIQNIIIEATSCSEKVVRNFLFFEFLPQYLSTISSNRRINFLNKLFARSDVEIVYLLNDFFVPRVIRNDTFTVIYLEEFWHLIQMHINSDNKLNQKQAIFLLKKSLKPLLENWDAFAPKLPKVIKINSENVSESWMNYLSVLQVIREEHYHLVEPSLTLLSKLNDFDPTWLKCIYQTLLLHPISAINLLAIKNLIKVPQCKQKFLFKDLKCLVSSLNNTDDLDLLSDVYCDLEKFLSGCDNNIRLILLEESLETAWSPIPLWYFYKCFLTREELLLPLEKIKKCLKQVIVMPHVYIRKGCMKLLINCALKTINHITYVDFDCFLKICCLILKQDETLTYQLLFSMNNCDFKSYVICRIESYQKLIVDSDEMEILIKFIRHFEIDIAYYFFEKEIWKKVSSRLLDKLYYNFYNQNDYEFYFAYLTYRLQNALIDEDFNDDLNGLISLIFVKNNYEKELTVQVQEILLVNHQQYSEIQKQIVFKILNFSKDVFLKASVCNEWTRRFLNTKSKIDTNTVLHFIEVYIATNFKSDCPVSESIFIKANDLFIKILETQYHTVLSGLFEQLLAHILLNAHLNIEKAKFSLLQAFKEVLNLNKNSVFKTIVDCFIRTVVINECVDHNQVLSVDMLIICSQLTELSKTYLFIGRILIDQFKKCSFKNPSGMLKHKSILVDLLLISGTGCTLAERANYDVCQEIFNEFALSDNPNLHEFNIRFGALEIIDQIINNTVDPIVLGEIAFDFVTILIRKYLNCNCKKHYFPNSEIHLKKQRIIQVLLVLQPYIALNKKNYLSNMIIESLCNENHQSSVRQLMQWLLVRLHKNCENDIKIIIDKIVSLSRDQSNLLIVFLPVIYHLGFSCNEDVLLQIFEVLLPLTMSGQFKLRLYSQIILYKLFEIAKSKEYLKIMAGFAIFHKALGSFFSLPNEQFDNTLQSDKEFFNTFKPDIHFTLQTIYVDIPKINGVTHTEWENFINLKLKPLCVIKVVNESKNLSLLADSKFKWLKNTKNEKIDKECSRNVQKKVETWSLLENHEIKTNDFILVGSLIDKCTNLGGLSRTCEVFGIKNLVVNNVKLTDNKEFKSLSMTSEKWMNIMEINKDNLREFLLKIKSEGYEVVAAEQTTSSLPLQKFKFPKKTILLLGNEKEGVPPDLLMLVDHCIEIPQVGIIRSLNVHVTGAIFMWEYCKQNLL